MNRLLFIAALFAETAFLSSSMPERAAADLIIMSDQGLHTVKEPQLRAELATRRAILRSRQVMSAPIETIFVTPLFLDPRDRGAILRARTLAHARALARRH